MRPLNTRGRSRCTCASWLQTKISPAGRPALRALFGTRRHFFEPPTASASARPPPGGRKAGMSCVRGAGTPRRAAAHPRAARRVCSAATGPPPPSYTPPHFSRFAPHGSRTAPLPFLSLSLHAFDQRVARTPPAVACTDTHCPNARALTPHTCIPAICRPIQRGAAGPAPTYTAPSACPCPRGMGRVHARALAAVPRTPALLAAAARRGTIQPAARRRRCNAPTARGLCVLEWTKAAEVCNPGLLNQKAFFSLHSAASGLRQGPGKTGDHAANTEGQRSYSASAFGRPPAACCCLWPCCCRRCSGGSRGSRTGAKP